MIKKEIESLQKIEREDRDPVVEEHIPVITKPRKAKLKKKDKPRIQVVLEKSPNNPIMSPIPEHRWEWLQTFNPAVIEIDGTVYLFYRAIGDGDYSKIGYASSKDGETIDERLPYPIFTYYPHSARSSFEGRRRKLDYVSGGGTWGGCEDPRVTVLEGRIYMIFVAFNGWDDLRLAMTSISVEDFLAKRFIWSPVQFLSDNKEIDKSGALFPEKINGKYAILHRVFPNILLDYEDSLDFSDGRTLEGRHCIKIRDNIWDSRKIGAGAPPIRIDEGWLLVYYATDDRNDSQYKIGIMVLDSENPCKVLYRTDAPALRPTEWYENTGHKRGIAYPCGAVIKDNKLFVYYGGGDTLVNVAYQDMDILMFQLKNQNVIE